MALTRIVHTDVDGNVTVTEVDVPDPEPTREEQLAAAVAELTSRLRTATTLGQVRSAAVAADDLLPTEP